jgi:hypothetical protein
LFVIQDHALGRALQRSPGVDLTELIWDGLANVRRRSIQALMARGPDRFRVAAGDGAFACAAFWAESGKQDVGMPMVVAKTWLPTEAMHQVQEGEIVDAGHPGERFDDVYEAVRGDWQLAPIMVTRTAWRR